MLNRLNTRHAGASQWENKILPLREQARIRDEWLQERLNTVLPELMRREQLEMWLVIGREYNEDPVMLSLLPATMLSARRMTVLVFHLPEGGELEALTVSRYGMPPFYKGDWDPEQEDQWSAIARIVRERNPASIGINCSADFAFGDGLSHTHYLQLVAALGPELSLRLRGAERLALGWLERRTEREKAAYTGVVQIAHGIIAEAFSSRVIHPGVTRPSDVVWWFRQRTSDLGLSCWFQPSVSIQREGCTQVSGNTPILPGDLLHCDFGLHYLGLATDTQQNAYVLKLGETDAPEGLKAALATGNRLQDILAEAMVIGRTGNEILLTALEKAQAEGIKASIYTHPIGYHGHGAGPTIGLWDMQQGVPGRGDYPLYSDTCHAMELNIRQEVPEWNGQEVRIALEQDVLCSGGQVHFLGGRQTKLHLIG
ncbi:MAG: M24 family metallopeptidase [Bacillota bacterium]